MSVVEAQQLPPKVRARLHAGERVVQCLKGLAFHEGSAGVAAYLILTPRRVIQVSTRWFSSSEVVIPAASIRSVTTHTSLGSSIVIDGGGDTIKFSANRRYLAPFAELLEQVRAGGSGSAPQVTTGSNPVEALKQLAELHAAGVLTDDEFTAKKTSLLARM